MTAVADRPEARLPGRATEAQARLRRWAVSLAGLSGFLLIALALWQAAIWLFDIPHYLLPTPETTLRRFQETRAQIGAALLYTLRSTAIGLALATIIALTLAGTFVASPLATRAFLPLVIGLRTAPVLAIAPILILVFGRGLGTSIAVVVIVSFFSVMVNAMKGFTAVRRNALELMHVCGAGWFQTFFKLRLPTALPFIITGLRAASAGAFLSAMLAEWLSGAPGLGTFILEAHSYRDLGRMWAAILATMAMTFVIFGLTVAAERRLGRWRR